MTPEERLKEITSHATKEDYSSVPYKDLDWLISRVKELTEALEFYAAIDTKIGVDELQCIARDALVGSKPDEKA